MDERDKELQELRRELAATRRELERSKAMQMRLFRLVPADRILELLKENPERPE